MRRFFNRLVVVSFVLAVGMSLLSAFIRLADSGFDCMPWPGCFGSALHVDSEPGITISRDDAHRGLRMLHRLSASVFGVLALMMAILALRYGPGVTPGRTVPVTVLALTLLLSWVGMNTPDVAHPIVALTNLCGGMLLGALLLWLLLQQREPRRTTLRGIALMALTYLAVLSGGWVSANFAAAGCHGVVFCPVTADAVAVAFDPGRTLSIVEGELRAEETIQGAIVLGHRLLALAVLLLLVVNATQLKLASAWVSLGVVTGLALLGIAEAATRSLLGTALAHSGLSLILLLSVTFHAYQLGVRAHD